MNRIGLLVVFLFLQVVVGGCATSRDLEVLPHYAWTDESAALVELRHRAEAVKTISAECGITLSRSDGQTVQFDGALVMQKPNRIRLRSWKFNRAVFDLMLNDDGLWLWTMQDASRQEQVLPASLRAADFVRELSLFTGGYFTEEPPPQIQVKGEFLLLSRDTPQGKLLCEVDRATLTPRRFYSSAEGNEQFQLKLSGYRIISGVPWATTLDASSGMGKVIVDQREVEINGDLAPAAFVPPRCGETAMNAWLARAGVRAVEFPARRPIATLGFSALLLALALFGVSRLRPDSSLQAMFAKNDPAADSLVRVLNRFSAVEELLVLVSVPDKPNAPAGPQPALLTDFAARFERQLKASPDSAALVDDIAYRADSDTIRFFEEVLVPAGIFYLDDASLAQAKSRLSHDGMRQQVARNEALLAQPGPAAAAAAKALLQDPLRLHEFLKPELAAAAGSFATLEGGNDAFISPDGRALLIRVFGKHPPSDLNFAKSLVAVSTKAADASNADHLNVSFGGAYAIATTSERALRADRASSVTGAFVSLIVLFAIVFRRPIRLLLLAVVPLALGSLLGFGAYAIVDRSMTILSAAVGAMMVGMGIDYSIHYLTHYEKLRAAGHVATDAAAETSRDLFAVLFAAWITSVMGFAVVGWSDIPALGAFALLGSLGLAGVFVTSLSVVPALTVLTDRSKSKDENTSTVAGTRARLRFSIDPLLGWIVNHARMCVAVSSVVFIAALGLGLLLPGPILPLEPDLSVMHPRPNAALETQNEIARRFGTVPGSLVVYLHAETPQELAALAHRVDERLRSPAVRNAGIAGVIGLSTFLPDPATARERASAIKNDEVEKIISDFRAAVADSAFNEAQYEPYAAFLRTLLSRRDAPTIADFLRYPQLARTILPWSAFVAGADLPTEAITLVSLDGSIDERSKRAAAVESVRAALADVPGATLTGIPVLGYDAEARVQRYVPRLFWISVALVLGYVIVHFRSVRDATLSLTTATYGMVVLLAVMRLVHVRLNMINLIGLPLLIGMTVDYGIFLVSLARLGRKHGASRERVREHVGSSAQAVLVCAGATLVGFGSLLWISVPAVRSLGLVVAVGMAAALASALFFLAPILLMPPRTPRARKSPAERTLASQPPG